MSHHRTRRRFLTATAATLGGLGLATTTDADDHRSFVLEQDGDCVPVVPLSGEAPVEEFYRWGLAERFYSSTGTRALQKSETSILFLYRGPDGLSLVAVHDALADRTAGGTLSFDIEGIPQDATWAVKDDLYDASSNNDIWVVDGTVLNATDGGSNETDADATETQSDGAATDDETADGTRTDEVDWRWASGRTDGGALRGLGVEDLELRIEPAFNDEAELASKSTDGEITSWELLSGDREDPDRTELDLDKPITLRTGSCDDGAESTATEADDDADPAETESREEDGDGSEEAEDAEDSDDDEETGDEDAEDDESSDRGPPEDAGPPDHANAPEDAGPPEHAGPD